MSIKHGYLANIRDSVTLVRANGGNESQASPSSEEFAANKDIMLPLFDKAKDEGMGIMLVLIGAVVSAAASFI